MNFSGKKALVTGSGSGIGKAIALLLAEKGADVVVNDISSKNAEETVAAIEKMRFRGLSNNSNVASHQEVEAMFEKVNAKFGKIDILVNNAGITRDGFLMKLSEEN